MTTMTLPAPLNPEQIDRERAAALATITKAEKRIKLIQIFCIGVVLILTAKLIHLWTMGLIPCSTEGLFAFAFGFIFFIVISYVVDEKFPAVFFCGSVSLYAFPFVSALSAALGVAYIVFAFVFALSVALAFNKYEFKLTSSQSRLDELTDLNAESGELCVKYLEWCQSDDDLRIYQNQIAAMARLPIMLDYKVAEDWIENKNTRLTKQDQIDKAIEACKTLAAWST